MVSGEPPLTQHRQDQGAGGGFQETEQRTPITIDKTPVERVNSFKFLSVHITEDLTWSAHTDAVLKKSHQRLFFLRRLRKFGMSPSILRSFYTCTVESELIHPTAHSHFTICHALHFNSTVQTGLHVHTALIQQSICYHWIPSNAHPWHLHIQLMYNLLHLCILLCMYICVHNVECVHTVYNVYW